MLKVLYQKLRLSSKGNLNYNHSNSRKLQIRRVGKTIVQGIPVLSIFALVGIVINAVILLNSSSTAEAVYAAEEVIGDSTASITISGAGREEQVEAGYGEVSYRAHTVRLQASNAKTHTLIISGPSTLVTKNKDGSIVSGATPTTINSASGVTGATMASDSSKSNIWGYGWGDTSTSNEDLVYTAPSTTGTALAAGNIDNATHNLDVTKKLAFAIKFSEDALPGRYTDTVTLQLVVTPRTLTTYSITYNANGGDDAPTTQSIESYEDSYSFTIPNTTPTRSGYNFLGWSTSSNASTADSNYAIGKTVTLTASNPSRVLYAVWKENVQTIKTITNMQQMTAAICAASTTGDTNTLIDTRDNSTYTVLKHTDGNCWMTQNLRIVNKYISAVDSDISSGSFTIPASSTSGFTDDETANACDSGRTTHGAYYTWMAATAGTGTESVASGNASSSICPKGWKLPAGTPGTNTNDFAKAAGLMNVNIARNSSYWSSLSAPVFANGMLTVNGLAWVAAGRYGSSSLQYDGTHGRYWTRTAFDGSNAYALNFYSGYFYPAYVYRRYVGFSIRCVVYSS